MNVAYVGIAVALFAVSYLFPTIWSPRPHQGLILISHTEPRVLARTGRLQMGG
jgi:hypothetical protein